MGLIVKKIGIAELRRDTSAILRRVREGEWFDITYGGRVIACLIPVERPADDLAAEEPDEVWRRVWAEMDETAAEIAKHWPEGVSAVDAVREQRRDLTSDEWGQPEERR